MKNLVTYQHYNLIFFYAMSRDVKMKNKLRTEGFVILGRVMFTFYGLL